MSKQVNVDSTSLAYELDNLRFNIESVRLELLDEDISTPITAKPMSGDTEPEPVEKASRLSQIRSKFRFSRRRSTAISRESSTVGDNNERSRSRTDSIDSAITLVDTAPPAVKDDTTYLTLLAPLIATLQKLSPLVQLREDVDIREAFLQRCEELSELFKELKRESFCPLPGQKADDESDDMRLLLLTALHKKVLIEGNRCSAPHNIPRASPLASILDKEESDPFSLHASSLTTLAPRTPSPPKRIAPAVPLQPGGFSEFMGHSQATWRRDVHRLGSFQASALFSPSPIAVNKAIKAGGMRL